MSKRLPTYEEAREMICEYWESNGFTEYHVSEFEINQIMNGDLTRLMIDPHKYDYLNEE